MPQAEIRVRQGVYSLFEPDALLPIQYFHTFCRAFPIEPEKRLMWAVLEDAIESFQSRVERLKETFESDGGEEEAWFRARDTRWLFSFDNICETLGIDPDWLRRGLLRWKEKQLRAAAASMRSSAGIKRRIVPTLECRALRLARSRS